MRVTPNSYAPRPFFIRTDHNLISGRHSQARGWSVGDRVGVLVHREQGTMQVFVNGVEQPVVFTSIPKTGPLFFVVELLSDNQRVRIIPDALPPQVFSCLCVHVA